MRNKKKPVMVLFIAATLMFGGSTVASAPSADYAETIEALEHVETIESLREFVQNQLDKHDVPGLSLALVDDQRLLWAEGFGYADVKNKTEATAETVYRAGSISKLFTVAAALRLAERKRLDIDRPLKDYLPEFSIKSRFPGAPPITPRRLMTHHAGLPRDYLKGVWSAEPFTNVVYEIKDEYVAYPPDQIFAYSKVGLGLLGHAVQSVSGRPFAEYLHTTLLEPLGMRTAAFGTLPAENMRLATPYDKDEPIPLLPLRNVPAGGLHASVLDLARFVHLVFADGRSGVKRVLRPETPREMLRVQNAGVPLDLDVRLGLGWFLGDHGLEGVGPVASHGGGARGFRSLLIVLPEHKLGVVVMANAGNAGPAVRAIAHTVLKRAYRDKTGREPTEPKTPKSEEPVVALSVKQGQTMAGLYYTPDMGFAKVDYRNGRLFARVRGKKIELTPHADERFSLTYRLWGFIPIKSFLGNNLRGIYLSRTTLSGYDVLLLHENGNTHIYGERVEPTAIPDAWTKRLGTLELLNGWPDMRLHEFYIEQQHGFLTLRYQYEDKPVLLALKPMNDTEAVILGLGTGRRGTVRVVRDHGVDQLSFAGLRFRMHPK